MRNKSIVYLFALTLVLQACASKPKIAVDPSSIKDVAKYEKDVEECRAVSLNYDSSDAVAKSAAVGAVGSLASAVAILPTQIGTLKLIFFSFDSTLSTFALCP